MVIGRNTFLIVVSTAVITAVLILVGCGKNSQTADTVVPSFCPSGYTGGGAKSLALVNTPPRAYYQNLTTPMGVDLDITLEACDPDIPETAAGMMWQITDVPLNGRLAGALSGTYSSQLFQVTYVPTQAGTDLFYYEVIDAEGATSNKAEIKIAVTTPGSGIDPAKVSGTWFGPARLAPASSTDNIPIFSVLVSQTFGTAKVSINSAGVVTSIDIDGTNFSSIGNSWQADFDPNLEGDKLVNLDFPNAPLVNIGSVAPIWVPVLDGGGLLFDQSATSGAGSSPQYAFLYIHDKFGTDLAIAVLERNANPPLPLYSINDIDNWGTPGIKTTWSGFTAEFVNQTISPPGAPLDHRFQGYPNWDLDFDTVGSFESNVTGSIMDSGTTVAITSGLVFESGSGYFTGTMTDEFNTTWNLNFLMSPDRQFIAGFGDDPSQSLPWRWHDIALTKQ
jgi:hypothetical protein